MDVIDLIFSDDTNSEDSTDEFREAMIKKLKTVTNLKALSSPKYLLMNRAILTKGIEILDKLIANAPHEDRWTSIGWRVRTLQKKKRKFQEMISDIENLGPINELLDKLKSKILEGDHDSETFVDFIETLTMERGTLDDYLADFDPDYESPRDRVE